MSCSGFFDQTLFYAGSVVWVCLVGCAAPVAGPIDHLTGPGLDEPLPNATAARWSADFDRLMDDIPRATKKLHWGLLWVRNESDRLEPRRVAAVVRAAALLPDGRLATVVVWSVNQSDIGVALRVGGFGDPHQENKFIRCLAKVLRGRPGRKQKQGFDWPDPTP